MSRLNFIKRFFLLLIITPIVICSRFLAWGASRLGDFEDTLREYVLFRDGSTTLTGRLKNNGGTVYIDPTTGAVRCDYVILNPETESSIETIKATYPDGALFLWRPTGGSISILEKRSDGRLNRSELITFDDRYDQTQYGPAVICDNQVYLTKTDNAEII